MSLVAVKKLNSSYAALWQIFVFNINFSFLIIKNRKCVFCLQIFAYSFSSL